MLYFIKGRPRPCVLVLCRKDLGLGTFGHARLWHIDIVRSHFIYCISYVTSVTSSLTMDFSLFQSVFMRYLLLNFEKRGQHFFWEQKTGTTLFLGTKNTTARPSLPLNLDHPILHPPNITSFARNAL